MRHLGVNGHLPTRQQASPQATLGFRGAVSVDTRSEWPTQTFQIPNWAGWSDGKKLRTLRQMAEYHGRDPELRNFVINTVISGVAARDYRGQAAAILQWVQNNIRYVNESNEQLQTPSYTLRVRHGDCDDMAILISAMAHSIALPFKFVLAGKDAFGRQVRWIEGTMPSFRARYFHIYPAIGIRGPFAAPRDQWWMPAEPTLKVPLGWDAVAAANGPGRMGVGRRNDIPELGMSGATGVETIAPAAPVPVQPSAFAPQIRNSVEPPMGIVGFLQQVFGQDLAVGITRAVITAAIAQGVANQFKS
jgi:hypothetical protein